MTTQLQERRQKMEQERREQFIDSLRKMADLLESADLRLPYWSKSTASVFARTPEELKLWAKALGTIVKDYGSDDAPYNFSILGKVGTIDVQVYADRGLVCDRIVIGSEKVEVTEPDPDFEVPLITRTITKEIVEWDCHSLLEDSK